MEDHNPWVVDSVDAFLFWKCPECTFDTNIEDNFETHAVENHPLSFVLFRKTLNNIKEEKFESSLVTNDNSNQGKILVKQEPLDINSSDSANYSSFLEWQKYQPTLTEDGRKIYQCSICDYIAKVGSLHKIFLAYLFGPKLICDSNY